MEYIFVRLEDLLRVRHLITCFTREANGDFITPSLETHDFWEMVYVRSGNLMFYEEDRKGLMQPGDVVFHAPNVPHGLGGDGEHPFSAFIITFDCNSPAMTALKGKMLHLSEKLQKLMEELIEERNVSYANIFMPLTTLKDAPLGAQQMLGLYLEQLLIGILRQQEKESQTVLYTTREELDSKLAAEVRSYLEEHLYDAVDMKLLCEKFHYGKSRLSEVFRRAYGDSVMHWYLVKRIEAAGQAILCGEGSIAEISARLQFDSPQYFSRIFKKHMGVSPREYRNVKR